MRGSDFNYKVALATGLKSLQAGHLRKAEEQFRYLCEKFPHADGGYRGIAKVATEYGDRTAALATLREGAAALSKAGERLGAIGLLREIVALDGLDHGAHRRLAAALILAGDRSAAALEYDRYVRLLTPERDGDERVRLELAYAHEQLGDVPELAAFVAGADPVSVPPPLSPPPPPPPPPPAPAFLVVAPAPPPTAPAASPAAPAPARPAAVVTVAAPADLEARAALAIAARDSSASDVILEAARAHLAGGRRQAATDLLLQTIAAGVGVHDAQRLLADATGAEGHALAHERCLLLARLHNLDGRADLAAELERLARTFDET